MNSFAFVVTTAFLLYRCLSFVVHPMLNVVSHDTILKQYINDRQPVYHSQNETSIDYEIPIWVNKSVFKFNLPTTFKAKNYNKQVERIHRRKDR